MYLLFAGDYYCPQCGVDDYITHFDTVEEVEEYMRTDVQFDDYDWYQIVDRATMEIIKSNRG